MKTSVKLCLISAGCCAGIAIACSELPIPPLPPLKVDIKDISKERAAGASDPFASAFNKKLDEAAEKVVGTAVWRNNYFKGNVSYTTRIMMMTGRAMIHVEKPCGQRAQDLSNDGSTAAQPGAGGGGGGGGGGGIGGWLPGGGGCYGNCQPPYGEVGPIEQA